MELVPQLVWLGSTIDRRYEIILEMDDIATEAAACAIALGDYDHALEWLEEGLSIVWKQILQLRTPFDDLAQANPSLDKKPKEVAGGLEKAGSRTSIMNPSASEESDLQREAKRHHDLANEWPELLDQARHVPGFHNFLRPQKAKELKSAARGGPVVVINSRETR